MKLAYTAFQSTNHLPGVGLIMVIEQEVCLVMLIHVTQFKYEYSRYFWMLTVRGESINSLPQDVVFPYLVYVSGIVLFPSSAFLILYLVEYLCFGWLLWFPDGFLYFLLVLLCVIVLYLSLIHI